MKTPQEKAKEIFEKMLKCDEQESHSFIGNLAAKQCALIAVDEKIKELMWVNILINSDNPAKEILNDKIKEMQEVKQEIELL